MTNSEGQVTAEGVLSLAHALRTPLTSLALGLGLLDEGTVGPLTPAQQEIVRVLVLELARLSLLVERGLRTEKLGAHAGPVERRSVDLGALVHRAVVPLCSQGEARSVTIALDLEEDLVVTVDDLKMTWVVCSIVGNAIRYSNPGDAVRVKLRRRAASALLEIADNGPGMPREVARQLFERGGGVGLYLTREIVEAHGGTIQVDSEVGRGSHFTIELPVG